MAELVGKKECWTALAITERTLDRWKLEDGFPATEGGYDVAAVRAWASDRDKKGSESDNRVAAVNMAIKLQKLEEIKRKNLLLQLEIDEKNRRLLPTELIHEILMACAAEYRGTQIQLQQRGFADAAKIVGLSVDRIKKIVSSHLGRPTGDAPK